MLRKAFKMSVNADRHEEYARRHDPIWQELADALLAHGVRSYSIYLDPETSELFAYAELAGHRPHGGLPAMVAPHAGADAVEPRRQSRRARAARGVPPRER